MIDSHTINQDRYNYIYSISELHCPLPQGGHLVVQSEGDVYYGSQVEVTCEDGYSLLGSNSIQCLDDQSFGRLPTCYGRFMLIQDIMPKTVSDTLHS